MWNEPRTNLVFGISPRMLSFGILVRAMSLALSKC
jgi:hypothetical protein